jgi:DNA polymerase III epsilon subunit-like protein
VYVGHQKEYFLCYEADMPEMSNRTSEFMSFDAKDEAHVKAVLETCFGPTVLSCTLLVLINDRVDIHRYPDFAASRSQNDSCYYQVYKPDEHHKQSSAAERIHRMSEPWLNAEGKDIKELFENIGFLKKKHPDFKFVAHNAPADCKFLERCIEKRIRFCKYNNILYPDTPDRKIKLKWGDRVTYLNNLLTNLTDQKKWICTLRYAKEFLKIPPEDEETRDYSLGSLYDTITHKKMPKMHDAQMDVYACATIYCHVQKIPDTAALQDLITAITPAVILSHKALDFWRYALKWNLNPEKLAECKRTRQIPTQNFRDFSGWWMCLKMDGFYVRLKRDGGRWRIFTRKGIELNPPRSFLQNFTLNFPDGMEIEGEVVFDTDQTCSPQARQSVEKHIENRYSQFSKLRISSLRSKKDFSAWHRLRIVVFAFPLADKTFQESWDEGAKVMNSTVNAPQHIVMCTYDTVQTTAGAIEIFKGVVQMGLEGLVIRDPRTKYMSGPIPQKKDSPVFKMKQKIVTVSKQSFTQTGTSKGDGKIKDEKEYTVTKFRAQDGDDPKTCKFTEWRP